MGQIDLHFYTWMFFRRLPYLVLATIIGAAIGVMVALSLPPTYVATAKILVESPRITSDLARSVVPTNAIEQMQIIGEKLTTRASLLEMARRLDIYPNMAELSESDMAADMRSRTLVEPLLFDTPRGISGALMFMISFEASDPELAARVANAYAGSIVDANEALRKDRAASALAFIRQDVDRLAAGLTKAEEAIAKFKNEHRNALPDTIEFRNIQQNTLQERKLQIQREEDALRNRKLTLAQIYAQSSGTVAGSVGAPEDQMIAQLRRILAEQRAVFAEESPNIVALRQRIAELEAEVREKRADTAERTDTTGMPVDLQIQFADIDSRLRILAAERQSIDTKLIELEQSIASTAENATILSRLERDYQNAQTLYNDAQQRLAEASTGARIEEEEIGQKLSLIESAAVPEKPNSVKRRYIAAGGAFGGFALGALLILLFEIWRSAIYRAADISKIYEGEPLVVVPYIQRRGAFGGPNRRIAALLVLGVLAAGGLPAAGTGEVADVTVSVEQSGRSA